jgi:nitrite reductase/ring-hydroxylating ferredoxin subunit
MPAINLNRRTALTAIAGTSAAFTLAACAAEPELAATTPPSSTAPETTSDPESTAEPTTEAAAAQPVGTVSDVPVGGATRFLVAGTPIIITQPSEGEFRGFVAICTHAGAAINGMRENDLYCGSHGSRFDTETGEVIEGPARNALGKVEVQVSGDELLVLR